MLRFFFCGANNTSLLLVVDPERKYEALEKYGINLIEMAKQGKLDPTIGCDEEI
jgi:ATP-dependent Clp protease ATP-binding subunit ClpA